MGIDTQDNEEQLEMLLMTLEEVRHGICLFQSENQAKRVSMIAERLGKEKVIAYNIADDDEEKGMVSSRDFRRWASESDAKVVIIYNLQLLGMRFGDEEVIERLNFMRDQILAIGKLFVFGVSPYFNILLSRSARDLYSCVLYHFIFQDSEEKSLAIRDLDMEELSGDDVLETSRYKELKERIQSSGERKDILLYLSCMESWSGIRQYLSYQEMEFIKCLAEEIDQHYMQREIEMAEVEPIWILADTWIALENAERSVPWYEKVLCLVREELGERHERYADALIKYADYYEAISNFVMCEKFYDQAIKIYTEKNIKYSGKGRSVLRRRAVAYRVQSKYAEALEIYQDLLNYQIGKYGEKYYGNVYLHSNIGRVYEELGELSSALLEYKRAMGLLDGAGKQGGWLIPLYQNMCMIYLKSGDGSEAWKYIKKAKRITEDIYGKDSSRLIPIYNCMSGVWNVKERPDKEFEYLQKALNLIRRIHMEDSEMASFIYHNFARMLLCGGLIDDAIALCKHAIKIREKVYGERNELTASSYEQMAYILYKASNEVQARKYIDKARSIYVALYGSQSKQVKRIDDLI